jgi:hypothetical protein
MNKECKAEIARIMSRTHPTPAESPLMLVAKWVYEDAAKLVAESGQPGLAEQIMARTIFKDQAG